MWLDYPRPDLRGESSSTSSVSPPSPFPSSTPLFLPLLRRELGVVGGGVVGVDPCPNELIRFPIARDTL